MRYLDYSFDKPTLPSPLETLEILCFVVVTFIRYHNIRKGARGDRFFGSRSITANFLWKMETRFSFRSQRGAHWIETMAPFLEAQILFNSLVLWIFACGIYLHGTIRTILSCRGESHVPVWCQFTDDRRRFYFGIRAVIESIWNGESNEIETSRFHCKVAKIWIFRNSDSKSLWKNSLALPYLIFTALAPWV